jgi:hypothetical protein
MGEIEYSNLNPCVAQGKMLSRELEDVRAGLALLLSEDCGEGMMVGDRAMLRAALNDVGGARVVGVMGVMGDDDEGESEDKDRDDADADAAADDDDDHDHDHDDAPLRSCPACGCSGHRRGPTRGRATGKRSSRARRRGC